MIASITQFHENEQLIANAQRTGGQAVILITTAALLLWHDTSKLTFAFLFLVTLMPAQRRLFLSLAAVAEVTIRSLRKHDTDIDVGVFAGFDEGRVIANMLDAGITLETTYGTPEIGRQLVFNVDGVKVDLFAYHNESQRVYHPVWDNGRLIKYWYEPFTTKRRKFMTLDVRVPADELRHIVQQYGPYWSDVVVDWDWRTSPHNLVY